MNHLKVLIIGPKKNPENQAIYEKVLNLPYPDKSVEFLDNIADTEAIKAKGYLPSENLMIYPCIGPMCLRPVKTFEDLQKLLEKK